jgi:hypothetical protein
MNRRGHGFLALLLSASLAVWSPGAYAEKNWWFLNAGTATCDDATTSPYASPEKMRVALIRNNLLKDMQTFRDKENNVQGVMFITNTSIYFYYFISKEVCEQVKTIGVERGFVGKHGELD